MKTFQDVHGNTIHLTFSYNLFEMLPKHVLVLCIYNKYWVFTKHKLRGLEFPGGKVEEGETPENAAKREVYEEVGGIVQNLIYIGQYEVIGERDHFVKNIYFADLAKLENKEDYLETDGPVFKNVNQKLNLHEEKFSFIMKDNVVKESLAYITKNILHHPE